MYAKIYWGGICNIARIYRGVLSRLRPSLSIKEILDSVRISVACTTDTDSKRSRNVMNVGNLQYTVSLLLSVSSNYFF